MVNLFIFNCSMESTSKYIAKYTHVYSRGKLDCLDKGRPVKTNGCRYTKETNMWGKKSLCALAKMKAAALFEPFKCGVSAQKTTKRNMTSSLAS